MAGRTDAGVHATGQVAHLDMPRVALPDEPLLLRRLAGVLPPDVRVRGVAAVPADFDARFSALWRRYEYRISDAVRRCDPLRRRYVLGWPRRAGRGRDGRGRRRAGRAARLRRVLPAPRGRHHDPHAAALRRRRAGDEIACTVVADAFCHSMVRSLVGALIAVGEGRRPATGRPRC